MRTLFLSLLLCLPGVAAAAAGFTVTSPDIRNGRTIPMVHVFSGCGGGDQSPALSWSGAPKGTESYAVTMFDPNAPTGSGWWHWTVANIPASVTSLPQNAGAANSTSLPPGAVQGRTDFGFSNYGGPCPPKGDKPHHYVITVYALKVPKIDVNSHSSGANVGFHLHFVTLAKAKLVGRWGRSK